MIDRRSLLAGGAALALPRVAIAQGDSRPAITIAVQRIAISNTLDDLREQSNVGTRMAAMYVERLIDLDFQGQLDQVPGLATVWRQIDERTIELDLRRGVKFHNGDEMTAEDVAFVGGGSLPDQKMKTWIVEVVARDASDEQLAQRLRLGTPAVMGRLRDGKLVLDVRTIFPQQEAALVSAIGQAATA